MHKIMGTGSTSMVIDPNAKEIYAILEKRIFQLKQELGEILLITGLAEGWDEAIAKVGLRNGIPYFACVPHPTYGEYYWGKKSRTGNNRLHVFEELLAGAVDHTIVCNALYVNGVHANFIRNSVMVDITDSALVYDAGSPGTRDAVAKLRQANKPYEKYPFTEQMKLF